MCTSKLVVQKMMMHSRNTFFLQLFLIALWLGPGIACNTQKSSVYDDTEEYRAFMERNNTLFNSGVLKERRDFIRKIDSFHYQKENHSAHCVAYMHASRSEHFYELHEYDSASLYVDSALFVFEKFKLQEKFMPEYINVLGSKGKILYASNHFTQAYNYYFKAKTLAEHVKDTCSFQTFNYGLAMIAYKQKKFREAADYFKRSYMSASSCPEQDAYRLQEDLDNIALSYEKLNMYDSALYYYDSAVSFILHNPTTLSIPITKDKALGVIYGNMGGVLLAKGNVDSAIALLKRSFSINIQHRYENSDALLTHLKLAKAYLAKNNMQLYWDALAKIKVELDTIQHPLEAKTTWRQLMYQYYEKTGKIAEAYQYYRDYASLRDSLWQLDKVQLQNDLSREIKDKEQASEIDLLQKQNQVNNLYLLVTIGFAVLALAIVALVYFNYRKSKKNIEKLKALNARINEQKKQLEQTTAQLRNSNLDKDRILHVVAHDLRSPISVIMMLTDMVLAEETNAESKESLEMMLGASRSALALISELLEFSGDAQKATMDNREQVEMNGLLKQSVDFLQFKAAEKMQQLRFTPFAEQLYIHVNREKVKRVISNIITNAIKFSAEDTTIDISVTRKNQSVRIEIKDNGIGIPDKYKPMIFEPFTSAKRYGTSGEKSFGLGLSICKQIVEANDGKIWFESTEGKGTSFFVEFRLSQE